MSNPLSETFLEIVGLAQVHRLFDIFFREINSKLVPVPDRFR